MVGFNFLNKKVTFSLLYWFLSIFLLIFFESCSPKQQNSPHSNQISLKNIVRIAVLPSQNHTNLSQLQKWPKNEAQKNKLWQIFNSINTEFTNRLGNASRWNHIKIVHQSQNPEYRIQLEFLRASLIGQKCNIPYEVKVYDQTNPSQSFTIQGSAYGEKKFQMEKSDDYYFWGDILQDYQSGFPYDNILENLLLSE